MIRILSLAIVTCLTLAVGAQTVFIPDVQFRAALNAWAPGLVDGGGFLADNNVGMHPGEFDLVVDWSPADLTGIEAIDGAIILSITFGQGTVLTCDSIGICESIALIDYPGSTLPGIGATTYLTLTRALAITALPDLQIPELRELNLIDLTSLVSAPVLPEEMTNLNLHGYPLAAPMPVLPSTLVFFASDVSDHPTIPDPLPPLLEGLTIDSMSFLQSIPTVPAGLVTVQLSDSGIEEFIAPLGIIGYGSFTNMSAMTTIQIGAGADDILVQNLPVLTSLSVGDGAFSIGVHSAPLLTDLSFGPDLLSLVLDNANSLTSIGALPSTLQALTIGHTQVASVPVLPEGLLFYNYSGGPADQLGPLPSSLISLDIGLCPITEVPDLPADLLNLGLDQLSIDCLPFLPDGLEQFYCVNTNVGCMPNHPPLAPQLFPLCTILNSSCPEYAPYISGHVFRDDDEDGQQDPGEPDLYDAVITASPSGHMTGTDTLGNYLLALPIGAHTITVESGLEYVLGSTPPEYAIDLPYADTIVSALDFAIVMDTIVLDTWVRITAWSQVKPGYDAFFQVHVENPGPTVHNVEVHLEFDPLLVPTGGFPIPQITPTELVWAFDSIPAGGLQFCFGYFDVPVSAQLGDTVFMTARVLPIFLQDDDPGNNVWQMSTLVVGSFDPNDKQVQPATLSIEEGAAGRDVHYLIRFQNTGTAAADRVLVTDTISADLDPSTFDLLDASHPCTWFYRDGALHFLFDPIFLPDSTSDEQGSHGFVSFDIDTRPGLLPGTTVPNIANIYFDFNEPVITEPCVLEVELPEAIASMEQEGVMIFPVPSNGLLQVRQDGAWNGAHYTILDGTGATLGNGRLAGVTSAIDLRSFPQGLYLLRIEQDGRTWTRRVIKE